MAPLSLKIVLDEGAVTRTVLFDSSTTVQKAHDIVFEKFYALDHDKEYGLFLTSADDDKSGIWLESHRALDYYMLRDGDSLQYLCKTRNLRVRMLDGAVKTLQVDESKVVGDLLYSICNKLGIVNYDEYGLCHDEVEEVEEAKPATGTLTLKRAKQPKEKDAQLELLSKKLKTDDNVEWLDQKKTLRELKVDLKETLLLKRRLFYSDCKIDARDPLQLNLLYVQTRDNILSGRQVTTEDKAIEFAGIQCQIQFGDYEKEKHVLGFIENLSEFLPLQYSSSSEKIREKKIYKEHSKHAGLSHLDAMLQYTKIARELPTYGVTFFLVKEQEKNKKKLVPRLLGINASSILRLDENSKEILKVWLLTQVKSYYAGKNTFTLNFGDYSDKEYTVKTNEAYRIRDILEGYIDIIKKKLAGPFNLKMQEGQMICEDNVEISRGNIVQNVVPQKVVEQTFVGPSKLISYTPGQEATQGTQIVTVQQMIITNKGNNRQQGISSGTSQFSVPPEFSKRLNRLNSQSVKAVMLLSDPCKENLQEARSIADNFEAELPDIIKDVEELAKQQTEEDRKRLLDELDELCKHLQSFNSTAVRGDLGTPENLQKAEDAAKKIAELSTLIIMSFDPRSRKRSELLRRSRKSFIADERVEATLRRASFLTISSTASKAVDDAIEDLEHPYAGPVLDEQDVKKLQESAVDKMGKLNAAIALLLEARADPKNVDYETAMNSMKTIKELTPLLVQDAKALGSTKDDEYKRRLLDQIRALCASLSSMCALTDMKKDSELQDAANDYAKTSGKLMFVFNPRRDEGSKNGTNKEDEIMSLAKDAANKTSHLLKKANELINAAYNDPRTQGLDNASVKCSDAAQGLLTCSQLVAPTIREPHCQSALTAALENLSSSGERMSHAWRPLVEEQQFQQYGRDLDNRHAELMKALDKLKNAYKDLDGKATYSPDKAAEKAKEAKRLQFITSFAAAKHSMEEIERELQGNTVDLKAKPMKDVDGSKTKLQQLLSQKLAQLNAATAAFVRSTMYKQDPDYVTATSALNVITELTPEIIKDTKSLCPYENEKTRKLMLEELAGLCKATRAVCAKAENPNLQDMHDASSVFAESSGKLYYIFNPRINPDKENEILDISRSACEKASEMLSAVYQLAEAVGGEEGARLDCSGTKVVEAAQALLMNAQINAPTIKDRRCQSSLISSADNVLHLTKELASLWGPILRRPEHQQLANRLHRDRELMEATLEKLRMACKPDTDEEEDNDDPQSRDKQRIHFITTSAAAKKRLSDADALLKDARDITALPDKAKNSPEYKELQRLSAQKLAELNAAIAALVCATRDADNPDYKEAQRAVATISQLTPEIIQNTNKLCPYVDEKQRRAMLDNIRALHKANKLICECIDKNEFKELNNAANKYANSSGKLCYVFNPRANAAKENQILDLSKEACEKTSEMLSRVYELAETVGGPRGAQLDGAGSRLVDAAQALLTTAQITAPSLSNPECQSGLVSSADTVSELSRELASLWEPLVRRPPRQALGSQLHSDQERLEAVLEMLRYACIPENEGDRNMEKKREKQHIEFIAKTSAAKKKMDEAEKMLLDHSSVTKLPVHLNKETPEHRELQRRSAQKLAELNAAIAALVRASADPENPDHKTAESAIATISTLMPEIVQNTNKLCEYADEKERRVMLDNVRALCHANKLLCDSLERKDVKGLNSAADKFANSSGKLCYVFNPRASSAKENKILDLSEAVDKKALEMSNHVHELAKKVGGEKASTLDSAGSGVVSAAKELLTTARITARSISDSGCQSALILSAGKVLEQNEKLASVWEPVSRNPELHPLGKLLSKDREVLDQILNTLRQACTADGDNTTEDACNANEIERLKFAKTTSAAKLKLNEIDKFLQNNGDIGKVPHRRNKNTSGHKELQHHLSAKLAELNAAIARLVQATSDAAKPDYATAESAILSISLLTPRIVQDMHELCEYEDDNQRQVILSNLRALCEANKAICDSAENGDLKELSGAANNFCSASGKLYYMFSPRADAEKENKILDLSEAACQKTSEMLTGVYELAEAVGGEEGSRLDNSGTSVVEAAQALLATAQITAPSISDSKCQSALISSADTVSDLLEKLAAIYEPIVRTPHHQALGGQIQKNRDMLEGILEELRNSCKDSGKTIGEEKQHLKLVATSSAAKKEIDKAEKLLQRSSYYAKVPLKINKDTAEYKELQRLCSQKLAELNAAIAALVRATSDAKNPDYKTAETSFEAISLLTPEIVQNTNKLCEYAEEKQRLDMLDDARAICKANRHMCESVETNDIKELNSAANDFANASTKLCHVYRPPLNHIKEKQIIDLTKAVGQKTSEMLTRVYKLAETVGGDDGANLDNSGARVVDAAQALLTTAHLTAPSIEEEKCQNALTTSANNLSSVAEHLTGKWTPVVQNPRHRALGEELKKDRRELLAMIEKLIAACKVKPGVSPKPPKPDPPVRHSVDLEAKKRVHFCKSVDAVKDNIKRVEVDLKSAYNKKSAGPLIIDEQEKLHELMQKNLALAGVTVSHLLSNINPQHQNYDSAIKATNILAELFPVIVKAGQEIGNGKEDMDKKEFLDDLLSLCEASNTLCDAAKNDTKNLNDVAVDFGKKASKLLYSVAAEVDPLQEKEVIRRTKELGDSASRLAAHGMEFSKESGEGDAVCSAAARTALVASELIYTAKLVAPSIHNPGSRKTLLDVSNQLSSEAKDLTSSWQPLSTDSHYTSLVKELDAEAAQLRVLLERFHQDLRDDKMVRRRVVEKLVVQDTPLRQLASHILDTAKIKSESTSNPPEDRRNYANYANKLAAAIKELDLANARCRNTPHDIQRRHDLEEAVQTLQQICLEARIKSGDEKRFVDLMNLINDVSSDAKALADKTSSVNLKHNKNTLVLQKIKGEADDIVNEAAEASKPPDFREDRGDMDDILTIKKFALNCDQRLDNIRNAIEEIRDEPSQSTLRDFVTVLKGSCNVLRFAVNSHVAAVRSATLDGNLADFQELEKKVSTILQSTRKTKKVPDEANSASATMATATSLCSALASPNAAEKIPPALATYLLEARSKTDLADSKQKYMLEEHLKRLLHLLKTQNLSSGRRVATWQEVDDGEIAEITHQIMKEIETFNKDDDNGVQKRTDVAVLNESDLKQLLLPTKERVVYGNQKELHHKLEQQYQKLSSMSGLLQAGVGKQDALARTLHAVAHCALQLDALARAVDAADPIQKAKIEEASQAMCCTTYNLLNTVEASSKDPHSVDSHRRLHEGCRLLNESINKLSRVTQAQERMKRDCNEISRGLQLQLGLLQGHYPTCTLTYQACLDTLQNPNNLQTLDEDGSEALTSLRPVGAMLAHCADLAAHCAYLLSLPPEHQHVAKGGFPNVSRLRNIAGDIRLACLKVIRSADFEQANYSQSEINKLVTDLQEVTRDAVETIKDPNTKRDVMEALQEVDDASTELRETLRTNRGDMQTATAKATRLLDASEDFSALASRIAVTPPVRPSAEGKTRSEEVISYAKTLILKTQALVKQVSASEHEVLTWKMFDTGRRGLVKAFEDFVTCVRENGKRAGLIEVKEEEKQEEGPKKTFVQIQLDLANKWLTKPAAKPEVKAAGIQAVRNIIELAEKVSEDMKDDERVDMLGMVKETTELFRDCSDKYNSEKASVLLERLRELEKMLAWRVVSRVVEDFLHEPLADLDVLADGERDEQKRKYILEKKIAELRAQLGRVTRTVRFVADTGSGPRHELMKTTDQVELLAPALVQAAQHRVEHPHNTEVAEKFRSLLAQYEHSLAKIREMCDRSVDPMDFAQAAGETMQRMREESATKNDPQSCAYSSRVLTRLGLRVVDAGLCSREVQSDPELTRALSAAQRRLAAAPRASRPPNWSDVTAEILRTTNQVESYLGGENIFQKQPEPNQPIYAAALDLHAAVREWSARDNEIIAVAKRTAVHMARLSDYMNTDRKSELLTTSKNIVSSSQQVAALARKLAMECSDMRIRTSLMQLCERIVTISGQLKMLITVKGSSLGYQGREEDREAMNTLVGNAQNLMSSIQEIVKAAIGASVKIASQRGPRIRWVRRLYY